MPPFRVVSEFKPSGDQPKAIAELAAGIEAGERFQTLLGITGSGKSATIAWTIEKVQKPTLVLAPNKALAAQLANEFRQFFPHNRVEYFVSYYDYYQPEAYIPQTDTYIEKDATINDEIDRLRHSATSALLVRRDVIIVASVSAIYGLGSPEQYKGQLLRLVRASNTVGHAIRRLVDISTSATGEPRRGKFGVKGDTLEVFPSYGERSCGSSSGATGGADLRMDPITAGLEELSEVFIFRIPTSPNRRMLRAIITSKGAGGAAGRAGGEELLEPSIADAHNYDLG